MYESLELFRPELGWLEHDRLSALQAVKQERLSRGAELFDLSMINPDIPPPRVMIDKLVEASLKPFNHRYAVSRGIRKLRESFAQKYARRFSVNLDPEHDLCVTMGTKDAILDSLICLASRGDTVLLAEPEYPAHLSAIRLAGLAAAFFRFEADEEALAGHISARLRETGAKILLLNFPHNPTGRVVGSPFYRALGREISSRQVFVINDFVYGEMSYDHDSVSLLSESALKGQAAEVYSLSKAYSVPGWRVAALAGESRLIRQVTRLKSHVDYGIFLPLQAAASHALGAKDDLVKPILTQYNNRCNTLATGLSRLGWSVTRPTAGACVWAQVPSHLRIGSRALAERLVREAGVVAMPGELFGAGFDSYLRFAAVLPEERIRVALERMQSICTPESRSDVAV